MPNSSWELSYGNAFLNNNGVSNSFPISVEYDNLSLSGDKCNYKDHMARELYDVDEIGDSINDNSHHDRNLQYQEYWYY